MGDGVVSQEFDVAELFRPPAPKGRRRGPVLAATPWYPVGHLALAAVTAAVVWFVLPVGVQTVPATIRAAATTLAAVASLLVWARFGPLVAAVSTIAVGVLCAGAGTLALYAPLAVAVIALAVVISRGLRRRRDGAP